MFCLALKDLKRLEEIVKSGAFEVNYLFWAKKNKNNTAVAKLQIPRGRVEWPAKSNFSVCVFTRVAIAGENALCQRLAVLSVMEVQWPII